LADKQAFSANIVKNEEERFASTLEQGMSLFEEIVDELEGGVIPGERAFRLYDTYGFPLEVTMELAAERGLSVDEAGFREAMEVQRVRSRGAETGLQGSREVDLGARLPPTEFIGYETLTGGAQVAALIRDGDLADTLSEGDTGGIVLDRTPFYAERGGQMGDTGVIMLPEGEFVVANTVALGDTTVHEGRLVRGTARLSSARVQVDEGRRRAIQANHTATHLLHEALRRFLGSHVDQAGSLVAPDRLRFDFTHHESVDRETLAAVEDQANEWIVANLPVAAADMPFADAKQAGARALFTEKYGDVVRTVGVEQVSLELCGGTHCRTTGEIGSLRIVQESSVAAGMRRLEAVTGLEAVRRARHIEEELRVLAQQLTCPMEEVSQRVTQLQERLTELQHEVRNARQAKAAVDVDAIVAGAETVGEVKVVGHLLPEAPQELLMGLVDEVAAKLGEGVVLLASTADGKVLLVCKASEGAVRAGAHAGNVVKEVATRCGGGGGGKASFARAGGKDPERAAEAVAAVAGIVAKQLGQSGTG
jgi:alanyl-tRNA synthetase